MKETELVVVLLVATAVVLPPVILYLVWRVAAFWTGEI